MGELIADGPSARSCDRFNERFVASVSVGSVLAPKMGHDGWRQALSLHGEAADRGAGRMPANRVIYAVVRPEVAAG